MHPLATLFLIYISGVIIMAFIIRRENAKAKHKFACAPPSISLLSWFGVIMYTLFALEDSSKEGFIAKLFNYTDKE